MYEQIDLFQEENDYIWRNELARRNIILVNFIIRRNVRDFLRGRYNEKTIQNEQEK